jgi:hypothetical protein
MSVGKVRRIRVLAAVLFFVFRVGVTGATAVYVNDATRDPSETLQTSGVSLSPMNGGWPIAVVGLGSGIDGGVGWTNPGWKHRSVE